MLQTASPSGMSVAYTALAGSEASDCGPIAPVVKRLSVVQPPCRSWLDWPLIPIEGLEIDSPVRFT